MEEGCWVESVEAGPAGGRWGNVGGKEDEERGSREESERGERKALEGE